MIRSPNAPFRPEHTMSKARIKLEAEHEGLSQSDAQ
jgi:hypothetical protein